jgi:hypothetical protein
VVGHHDSDETPLNLESEDFDIEEPDEHEEALVRKIL